MKFGAMIATRIADWHLLVDAEEMGFDHGWVPDSQMIWSDCYAVLALVAAHTKRMKIGTGVAIVGTRIAPVTAHSIATINQIAPGRVFLGIGTGHTAMRVMGIDPVKPKVFARISARGARAAARRGSGIHVERRDEADPLSASGHGLLQRRAAGADLRRRERSAGARGGRRVRRRPDLGRRRAECGVRQQSEEGARRRRSGRTRILGRFPHRGPDVQLRIETGREAHVRSRDRSGGLDGGASLHFWWELYRASGSDAFIRPKCATCGTATSRTSIAFRAERHLRVHDGHCTYLMPDERKFITPELIRASGGLVGEPDEIIAMLREQERGGLKEVTLLPPMASARECYSDFAKHVIERY